MITFSDQFYSKYYYGHRATLSISNVLPLLRIPEGAIICNVEYHVSDSGVFTGMSRDYAIVISRNPNNDTWMGGAPRRRKAALADGCL